MVWQVKRLAVLVYVLALIFAIGVTAQAATHQVYENGSLSTTYITYFKDILSGVEFNANYVAFRSGQYSYTMVVGDIEYENGVFLLVGDGKEYEFSTTSSGYNSQYNYYVNDITEFSVNAGNSIIYSDVGNYPQLIERGAKYEMFTAVLLCVVLVCIVINRIFYYRKR